MFFEGSEKKAEIIIDSNEFSLLEDVDDVFWSELVNSSQAKILSGISNGYCKAFILSESSLFIWHNRFVILTCGNTRLVNSVIFFLQNIQRELILQVSYQRKNEYYSHAQLSCFGEDIQQLGRYMEGKAYRFGEMDCHHNYLFQQKSDFCIDVNHKTYQLLLYQISDQSSFFLSDRQLVAENIRDFLSLEALLPGYAIDDHVFSPYGYSLNAIKDNKYLTIHITPQAGSSYVSVESNINLIALSDKILPLFEPQSFDLLCVNELNFKEQVERYIGKKYISKALVEQRLDNKSVMCFANYIVPQNKYRTAALIDINSNYFAL